MLSCARSVCASEILLVRMDLHTLLVVTVTGSVIEVIRVLALCLVIEAVIVWKIDWSLTVQWLQLRQKNASISVLSLLANLYTEPILVLIQISLHLLRLVLVLWELFVSLPVFKVASFTPHWGLFQVFQLGSLLVDVYKRIVMVVEEWSHTDVRTVSMCLLQPRSRISRIITSTINPTNLRRSRSSKRHQITVSQVIVITAGPALCYSFQLQKLVLFFYFDLLRSVIAKLIGVLFVKPLDNVWRVANHIL